jgi:RNA ligase
LKDGLEALTATLVKAEVRSREQWHEWKRGNEDVLAQLLDYRQLEGMPDVKQIIVPHFHKNLPLIGFNYTPAAGVSLHHYQDGWSDTLKLCRGITFDFSGRLVAKPFPKFFNFGEIGGDWGDGSPEVTVKEDGHLLIVFRYEDKVLCKTRGEFHSPTAILGEGMIREDLIPHWRNLDLNDVTALCELIHPETKVGVDYGDRRALILIGLYDNVSGQDLNIVELREAADALGLELVQERRMSRDDLIAVVNGGGNNAEGFVARWPDGHRVKFKYAQYMEEMREARDAAREARRPSSEPLAGVGRSRRESVVQRGATFTRLPARR